jgi:hypothetical protein
MLFVCSQIAEHILPCYSAVAKQRNTFYHVIQPLPSSGIHVAVLFSSTQMAKIILPYYLDLPKWQNTFCYVIQPFSNNETLFCVIHPFSSIGTYFIMLYNSSQSRSTYLHPLQLFQSAPASCFRE